MDIDNKPSMIAWTSAILAIYTVGHWAVYKYYGARVLLNHVARQFNNQQQQRQALIVGDDEDDEYGGVGGAEVEMIGNAGQQVQEAAAGMAIQAIEQVFSGNVTPNFGSPINKRALNQQLLRSPNMQRYQIESDDDDDDDQYDGSFLESPAKRAKPFKLTLTLPKDNPNDVSILG